MIEKLSGSAKRFFNLWLELEEFCDAGEGSSAEAERVRDNMDVSWDNLREEEKELLNACFIEHEALLQSNAQRTNQEMRWCFRQPGQRGS